MIEDTKLVEVKNRDSGYAGYELPNNGIKRTWAPGETKKIPFGELQQLMYIDGGANLIKDYLQIEDTEVLDVLNVSVEQEYFYSTDEIKRILFSGSLDELEDFLNFAPKGCLEVAKDLAVKEELPDTRKRKMMSEKMGFSIDNAIMVNTIMNEETPEETPEVTRKVQKAKEDGAKVTSDPSLPPKRKVVK